MRAGPKFAADDEPLNLSHLPPGGPERVIAFIQEYATIPAGKGAGRAVVLRDFQKEFIYGAFAPGVVVAGFSLPRGSGKTGLSAMICLYALYGAGTMGPRVFACATSERQAGHVFDACRSMAELHPALARRSQIHTSKIVVPGTDGRLEPLPATPAALQGYAPALVVVDECAEVSASTFEAMQLSLGKTPHSLLIGISTAPVDPDSSWNRLRDLAQSGEDKSLYWREWSAPEGCDPSDPAVWAACNPAYGDFLDPAAIASSFKTTRLESFMRYRLNMPVSDAGAWIPWGTFEALAAPGPVPAGTRIVVGFDGSVSGDSTVLIGATVDPEPYVFVIAAWEAPENPQGAKGWQVPRAEVSAAVAAVYDRYDVAEFCADPPYWRSEIQQWAAEYPNVVEFPSHQPARMGPATDLVYSLITDKRLAHDGSDLLMRHVRNCVVRQTTAGDVVSKNHKDSPRRIDAAIGMILAVSRAVWHSNQPQKRYRVGAF